MFRWLTRWLASRSRRKRKTLMKLEVMLAAVMSDADEIGNRFSELAASARQRHQALPHHRYDREAFAFDRAARICHDAACRWQEMYDNWNARKY